MLRISDYILPEAMRVPIMLPAGRFRLQASSTEVDSSGITMLPSYSMYLKIKQNEIKHELQASNAGAM